MISREPAFQFVVGRDAALFTAGRRFGVIDGKFQDHAVGICSVNGTAVAVLEHVEVRFSEAGPFEASFHPCLRFGIHVHRDVVEGRGGHGRAE